MQPSGIKRSKFSLGPSSHSPYHKLLSSPRRTIPTYFSGPPHQAPASTGQGSPRRGVRLGDGFRLHAAPHPRSGRSLSTDEYALPSHTPRMGCGHSSNLSKYRDSSLLICELRPGLTQPKDSAQTTPTTTGPTTTCPAATTTTATSAATSAQGKKRKTVSFKDCA